MVDNNIYKLQNVLKELNIELIFSGTFSQGLIEELGDALMERLSSQRAVKSKISAAFFTFIELAQNIKNYIVSKKTFQENSMIEGSGIIAISKTGQGYCINSGNIISNEDLPKLREKLERIVAMDSEALNNLFKESIKAEIDRDTGRAGIGLLQVARKSSEPIRYQFESINESCSFYTLTVTV